jgi:serine/threonine protein kinase
MSAGRQYKLIRELGTGTFGTVYQADMEGEGGFKKQVALKVLHPMWEGNKDAARRFRDEARMLGQIRHRHIVQVDGLVRLGGRWAVVMEYIPGVDGNLVIKACRKSGESFPVPATLEVVSAVAGALDAAYNDTPEGGTPLKVIHRDIKPSNIRLTADGDVKVLDFGIARGEFEGREAFTQSVRYGSVRYMSPERRLAEKDTPNGDIYALGCVMYEFLCGQPLGNAETERAQHLMKIGRATALVRVRTGEEADQVVTLLEQMLEHDQDKRPTAKEVSIQARKLARTLPGEDLATFARRFLPKVYDYVADNSTPMDRVVNASDGGSSAEVLQHAPPPNDEYGYLDEDSVTESSIVGEDAPPPDEDTEDVATEAFRADMAPAPPPKPASTADTAPLPGRIRKTPPQPPGPAKIEGKAPQTTEESPPVQAASSDPDPTEPGLADDEITEVRGGLPPWIKPAAITAILMFLLFGVGATIIVAGMNCGGPADTNTIPLTEGPVTTAIPEPDTDVAPEDTDEAAPPEDTDRGDTDEPPEEPDEPTAETTPEDRTEPIDEPETTREPETSKEPEMTKEPEVSTGPWGQQDPPKTEPDPPASDKDPWGVGTEEPDPDPPPPAGEKLKGAKFTMAGAKRMTAICVGADASGTTSVLVRDIIAGSCNISAEIDGISYATTVNVTAAGGYNCSVDGGKLTCK